MRFRPTEQRDLAICRTLINPDLGLTQSVLCRIVDIWEGLISGGTSAVIEDPALRYPESIQGFGLSAFVADEFVEEFLASRRGHLDAAFYERVVEGRSPVLAPVDVGRANRAGALNLVVLNFSLRHDMADPRTERVMQAASAAFYILHAGYRLRILLNEVIGVQAAQYMKSGGFRLVDVAGPGADRESPLAAERRPYLFALRREWIAPGAVHPLAALFHSPTPRLGFSAAEQRVLFQALLNASDAEIAASLGLSLDGVKKTWRRVYDRVSRRLPYLFAADAPMGSAQRGAEKRRHLLEYLRAHLEEVRPWSASRSQRRGRRPAP